ncbi:hypothetical protein D3C86_2041380 [compost metagenome]
MGERLGLDKEGHFEHAIMAKEANGLPRIVEASALVGEAQWHGVILFSDKPARPAIGRADEWGWSFGFVPRHHKIRPKRIVAMTTTTATERAIQANRPR